MYGDGFFVFRIDCCLLLCVIFYFKVFGVLVGFFCSLVGWYISLMCDWNVICNMFWLLVVVVFGGMLSIFS